ncbi:hypothetical protein EW145_g2519 [Phellinidium pouzarii]|uniref:Post-GPI attachment to proteins factor 3 n=1 Tax=Phellinidium pouzarii TaxID=167371 RepID=A0A4S4LAS3_9AGAM|nr:hypothetical protein EW145_g2519 [Phellinidium pouzarii]
MDRSVASAGDRSSLFTRCLQKCELQECTHTDNHSPNTFPLSLRLTHWTCTDNCAYSCMHQLTDVAIDEGHHVLQYYGKWPFWRLLGMQEPASVLFSLLNLWVHVRGYNTVKKRVPDGHPSKSFVMAWSVVSMNAWVCSAIFHTRDKPITEKLDYFSAALVFIVALYTAVARFFFLGHPRRQHLYVLWGALCVLTYGLHVTYLSVLPRFDYTYNIIFNLVLGLAHNFLWLLYTFPESYTVIRRFPPSAIPRRYRPRCASKVALCAVLTMAAMSLELFDFPPIERILDAHALWHAATVPITALWYSFQVEDALDEGWQLKIGRS